MEEFCLTASEIDREREHRHARLHRGDLRNDAGGERFGGERIVLIPHVAHVQLQPILESRRPRQRFFLSLAGIRAMLRVPHPVSMPGATSSCPDFHPQLPYP